MSAPSALRVYLPLLLLGVAAGLVHRVARNRPEATHRRFFDILWILMILAGAPLWLFAAAALGWL